MDIVANESKVQEIIENTVKDFVSDTGILSIKEVEVSVKDEETIVVELFGVYRMTLGDLMNAEKDGSTNAVIEAFFEVQEEMYGKNVATSDFKNNRLFKRMVNEEWDNVQKAESDLFETVSGELFNVIEDLTSVLKSDNKVNDGSVEVFVNFGYMDCELMDFDKESFVELIVARS